MAGFTDYTETKILNHLRGAAAWSMPAGLYVGLFTTAPTDAGGGTEATTTIRPAGRPQASFGAPDAGTTMIANDQIVDFGAAAGQATVTHFAIFDATTGGNMLAYGQLTAPLTPTAGIGVSFAVGQLTVSQD